MKDINLFSNQVNKKKDSIKRKSNKRVFIFVGVFLGLMTVAAWVYMQIDIMAKVSQIANYQSQIDDPDTIAKLAEYNNLKKEADSITSYGAVLDEIDKAVILAETITSERIKNIADVVPTDMIITFMIMEKESVTITGECEINDSVAEFEHNLKQLDFMESVFVSNMIRSDTEDMYSFLIVCTVKGGVE